MRAPQLATITNQSGLSLNFKCPYHASVMKIFEMKSSKAVIIIHLRLCAELEFALALLSRSRRNLKRTARTLPSLDPRPRSKEGRTPMRGCPVNRKAGHVERGSQKPNEDCRDGYQKLGCALSFCSQVRLVLVARRRRKFSFALSPLNLEVVTPRCETPESISNIFDRPGPRLRLTYDHDQTARCSCLNAMVIP
jgi:hypothetical protein